jgi:hypothetical protein
VQGSPDSKGEKSRSFPLQRRLRAVIMHVEPADGFVLSAE